MLSKPEESSSFLSGDITQDKSTGPSQQRLPPLFTSKRCRVSEPNCIFIVTSGGFLLQSRLHSNVSTLLQQLREDQGQGFARPRATYTFQSTLPPSRRTQLHASALGNLPHAFTQTKLGDNHRNFLTRP